MTGVARLVGVSPILSRFVRDESGRYRHQYGLIAGLIAVVIIVSVTTVGTNLTSMFTTVSTSLNP